MSELTNKARFKAQIEKSKLAMAVLKRAIRDLAPNEYENYFELINLLMSVEFLETFLDASTLPPFFKLLYSMMKSTTKEPRREAILSIQTLLDTKEGLRQILMSKELVAAVLEATQGQDLQMSNTALDIMIELA